MLTGMSIANFKAFGDASQFDLAPITLIYGENSAGKSSIIQALLSLSQSIDTVSHYSLGSQGWKDLNTAGRRSDLGTARDVVYQRDISNTISIKLQLDIGSTSSDEDIPSEPLISSVSWNFLAPSGTARRLKKIHSHYHSRGEDNFPLLSRTRHDHQQASILKWNLSSSHPSLTRAFHSHGLDHALSGIRSFGRNLRETLERYIEEFPKTNALRTSTDIAAIVNVIMWEGKTNPHGENYRPRMRVFRMSLDRALESLGNYTLDDFVADTSHFLQSEARARFAGNWLRDLGQLLDENRVATVETRRILILASMEAQGTEWPIDFLSLRNSVRNLDQKVERELRDLRHVGPVRQRSERLTLSSSDPTGYIDNDGSNVVSVLAENPSLVERINKTLVRIGVPYEITVWRVEQDFTDALFSLQLTDLRTGTRVSMLDVGYGISQLIPIIVQLEIAKRSIVLIEQPELHLHPRQQAALGSLFMQSFHDRDNQIVLETHSEQIILRIQRLIREGSLSHQDVCVLYVTRDEKGSEVVRLNIDKDGDFIDAWPGGFFDDGLSELLGLGGLV